MFGTGVSARPRFFGATVVSPLLLASLVLLLLLLLPLLVMPPAARVVVRGCSNGMQSGDEFCQQYAIIDLSTADYARRCGSHLRPAAPKRSTRRCPGADSSRRHRPPPAEGTTAAAGG